MEALHDVALLPLALLVNYLKVGFKLHFPFIKTGPILSAQDSQPLPCYRPERGIDVLYQGGGVLAIWCLAAFPCWVLWVCCCYL